MTSRFAVDGTQRRPPAVNDDVDPLFPEFTLQTSVKPQLPFQNVRRFTLQLDVQIDIAAPRIIIHTRAKKPHLRRLAQHAGGGGANPESLLVGEAHGNKSTTAGWNFRASVWAPIPVHAQP